MDILSLDVAPQTLAILGFLVIATIKLIDQIFKKDLVGASKIIGAAVVGGLVALGVDGLTVLAGVSLGLSASGLVTTAKMLSPTTEAPVATNIG